MHADRITKVFQVESCDLYYIVFVVTHHGQAITLYQHTITVFSSADIGQNVFVGSPDDLG